MLVLTRTIFDRSDAGNFNHRGEPCVRINACAPVAMTALHPMCPSMILSKALVMPLHSRFRGNESWQYSRSCTFAASQPHPLRIHLAQRGRLARANARLLMTICILFRTNRLSSRTDLVGFSPGSRSVRRDPERSPVR